MIVGVKQRRKKTRPLTEDEKKLVENNLKLVFWAVQKMGCGGDDEALSEAQLGLMEAAQSYNPNKGAFSTFAFRVIQNRVMSFYGRRPKFVMFDEADKIAAKEDDSAALYIAECFNNPKTRAILSDRLGGYSWPEVEIRNGVSENERKKTLETVKSEFLNQ